MRTNRIKFITELEKRDMTQKRLAELSGVSRATINYIKGGKRCTDEIGQKKTNTGRYSFYFVPIIIFS